MSLAASLGLPTPAPATTPVVDNTTQPQPPTSNQQPTQMPPVTAQQAPNAPQFQPQQPTQPTENNTVQTLLQRLALGDQAGPDPVTPPTNNQQQQQPPQQQQQTQQQQPPADPASIVVSNFMANVQVPDYTKGLDLEKVQSMVAEGDIQGFIMATNHAAGAAVTEAMTNIVKLLPSFADSLKAEVMREVGTVNRANSSWDQFSADYPEFKPYRQFVEPQLQIALGTPNTTQQLAFQTVAQLHSGLVANGMQNNQQQQQNFAEPTGRPFDIGAYLKPTQ